MNCPLGTYYSMEHSTCESCLMGSYQDEEGQLECKLCPPRTHTEYLHSRSISECKGRGLHALTRGQLDFVSSCNGRKASLPITWSLSRFLYQKINQQETITLVYLMRILCGTGNFRIEDAMKLGNVCVMPCVMVR